MTLDFLRVGSFALGWLALACAETVGVPHRDAGRPDARVSRDAGRDAGRDAAIPALDGGWDAGADGGDVAPDGGWDGGEPDSGFDGGSDAGPSPLGIGLVGLWNFSETMAGTAPGGSDFADQSGFGNHARASGGVTFGAPGVGSNAVGLDGSSGYAVIPDAPSLRVASVSIGAWFALGGAPPPGSGLTVLSKPQSDAPWGFPFLSWMIRVNSLTTIEAVFGNAGGYSGAFDVPSLSVGAFHHVLLSFDGTNIRLYLDGAPVGAPRSFPGPIAYGPQPLLVGADHGAVPAADFFRGTIDQVAVWDRALSDVEVEMLFDEGRGVVLP
jgi:hypothetical protein